jgi:hypothetical protein
MIRWIVANLHDIRLFGHSNAIVVRRKRTSKSGRTHKLFDLVRGIVSLDCDSDTSYRATQLLCSKLKYGQRQPQHGVRRVERIIPSKGVPYTARGYSEVLDFS